MTRSPLHPLERSVLQVVKEYGLISRQNSILVAVSGGPDSTALLLLLKKLFPANIGGAAYINHNLRPEDTASEKQHVQSLCQTLEVEFFYTSANVPGEIEKTGDSPEDCARRMRYQALHSIIKDCAATTLAVGHTRDDQVEEIVIRLIRGSGLKGLAGMDYMNDKIIRPLLNSSKQDLLDYLTDNNQAYCSDKSNLSPLFLRNRVRHTLLPLLEEQFNPSIKNTILNTAAILRDEDNYLQSETSRMYGTTVSETFAGSNDAVAEISFTIDTFKVIHPAIGRRIIEKMFWRSGARPSFTAIESVLKIVRLGKTGLEQHHANGLKIYKTATEIVFSSNKSENNTRKRSAQRFDEEFSINKPGKYHIPSLNKWLSISLDVNCTADSGQDLLVDAEKVSFPLTVRAAKQAERFMPLGAPGGKKVSRFLADRKIPKQRRYAHPVLAADNTIIAVLGLAIADFVKIRPETQQCLRIKWSESK